MNKLITFIVCFCIFIPSLSAKEHQDTTYNNIRPKKVGLVLSGGGAKGVAHIGVLKVLEEIDMPIDYISGTSMGALIGALYAVGYSAHELDSLIKQQDWVYLLSDKMHRNNLRFSEKESDEKFLLSMPLSRKDGIQVPTGLIRGQNVYNLFTELLINYHDTIDFATLPIPFTCVAADIVSGKEVILKKGILAEAMRASMAIPAAYKPIRKDSMILVDGGVINNFPVDVARDMGADVTIGIDLGEKPKNEQNIKGIGDIISQLSYMIGMEKYDHNKETVDLYMSPDLQEYNMANFESTAIDTMIQRGEQIARANIDKLIALKESLNRQNEIITKQKRNTIDSLYISTINISQDDYINEKDEKWIKRTLGIKENIHIAISDLHKGINALYGTGVFSNVHYSILGKNNDKLVMHLTTKHNTKLNFGFRFDSEEMASVLLNNKITSPGLQTSQLSITARLNTNPYIDIMYSIGSVGKRHLEVSYFYKYNDLTLNKQGNRFSDIIYSYHNGEIKFTKIGFNNFKVDLGINYENYIYKTDIYNSIYEGGKHDNERYFTYNGSITMDTYDKKYYPEKGFLFKANYTLHTDNMYQIANSTPLSAVSFNYAPTVRLDRRVYLMPTIYGRFLLGDSIPAIYTNAMGGEVHGRYYKHQLPFYGINRMELFQDNLLVSSLALRYRLGTSHYLILASNYSKDSDKINDILNGRDTWGGALSYAYNSIIGPLSFTIDTSNRTKKVQFYLNIGYYF